MKKVIVIGASNAKKSINKQLANYTASLLRDVELIEVKLEDYDLPIYNIDTETEEGIPEVAKELNVIVESADGFIISFAEHNGAYSAVFKNVFDWLSRIEAKVWRQKPSIFLATSPGGRGGISVLELALTRMPYNGADIVGSFSLPSFQTHFKEGKIVNEGFYNHLKGEVEKLQNALT